MWISTLTWLVNTFKATRLRDLAIEAGLAPYDLVFRSPSATSNHHKFSLTCLELELLCMKEEDVMIAKFESPDILKLVSREYLDPTRCLVAGHVDIDAWGNLLHSGR